MPADFKLGYDPSDGIKGLEALRNALLDAEKAGKKVPASLIQMIDKTIEVARVADHAATSTDNFETQVAELYADLSQADNAMGSFAVTTTQVNASITTASKRMGDMNATAKRGKVDIDSVKDSLGGLDSVLTSMGLGSVAVFAGESERLFKGFKDFEQAGSLGKLTLGIGSLAAILGSAYVLWQDYAEAVEQNADANSFIDGTILKLGQSLGMLTEEMVNESESSKAAKNEAKAMGKAFDEAAKKAYDLSKSTSLAVDDMVKSLEASRALRQRELELAGENNAEVLGQQIDAMIAELKRLDQAGKLTADQVQKSSAEINRMESRRVEILNEQKQAEAEISKQRQDQFTRLEQEANQREQQRKDDHLAELDRIDGESSKREIADNKAIDRQRTIAITKQKASQPEQTPTLAQPLPSKPVNPYGEGEAPTAGQQSDPYGGMLGLGGLPSFGYKGRGVQGGAVGSDLGFSGNVGMGMELPSFGYQGKQSSGRESGSLDDRNTRKQTIDAAAAKKAEDEFRKTYRSEMEAQGTDNVQGFIERSGELRESRRKDFNKFEKHARGDVGRDLKDGSTEDADTQKAADDAIRDSLQKQLDQLQKGGAFGKDVVDLSRDIVSKLQEEDADIQQLAQDVQDLKKAVGMVGSKKNGAEFETSNRNKAQRLGKGN